MDDELDPRHNLLLLRTECVALHMRVEALEAAIGSLALTLMILIAGHFLLNFSQLPPPR